MKRPLGLAMLALGAALACASCSGGGGGGGTNFDAFVHNVVNGTADDTEPESINGRDFDFSEDEHAFDDLFP